MVTLYSSMSCLFIYSYFAIYRIHCYIMCIIEQIFTCNNLYTVNLHHYHDVLLCSYKKFM